MDIQEQKRFGIQSGLGWFELYFVRDRSGGDALVIRDHLDDTLNYELVFTDVDSFDFKGSVEVYDVENKTSTYEEFIAENEFTYKERIEALGYDVEPSDSFDYTIVRLRHTENTFDHVNFLDSKPLRVYATLVVAGANETPLAVGSIALSESPNDA